MNVQIRRLATVFILLYGALFVQLNIIQLFGAERLNNDPNNTRPLYDDFDERRGDIVSADGALLATTVEIDDPRFERQRTYPTGDLFGHVSGFFSFNFGADGVEREYDDLLSGDTNKQKFSDLGAILHERDLTADIELTLRRDVQQVARDALGDRKGSVVAIDPRTGAILAAHSWPNYDPSKLSDPDAARAEEARQELLAADGNPLLPKFYREIFFPGSTFKVITAAAGLETGAVGLADPVYPTVTSYTPPLSTRPISNFEGSSCGGRLIEVLRRSCNSAFTQMAAEQLGPNPMIDMAEAFGFNWELPIDLPAPAVSNFPTDYGSFVAPITEYVEDPFPGPNGEPAEVFDSQATLAQAAIGQNDVKATPILMAMVAGAIANDGLMMKPYVMDRAVDQTGDVVAETEPSLWIQSTRPSTAATLQIAMEDVVKGGTASGLAINGFTVGGKTGTAQLGTPEPQSHAWIIGYAGPSGEPASVAVAVLVEAQQGASEQTGGRVAAPIARAVLEQALRPIEPVTD
ncbi:MAG: penicillin-binding protein 2 [Acidobacteria bacterium]|nr:penicillin-binding protein 2 [Acidobacteriota bacterium]